VRPAGALACCERRGDVSVARHLSRRTHGATSEPRPEESRPSRSLGTEREGIPLPSPARAKLGVPKGPHRPELLGSPSVLRAQQVMFRSRAGERDQRSFYPPAADSTNIGRPSSVADASAQLPVAGLAKPDSGGADRQDRFEILARDARGRGCAGRFEDTSRAVWRRG